MTPVQAVYVAFGVIVIALGVAWLMNQRLVIRLLTHKDEAGDRLPTERELRILQPLLGVGAIAIGAVTVWIALS